MSKDKKASITNTTGVGLIIAAFNSAFNLPKSYVDIILYISPFISMIIGLFIVPSIISAADVFNIKASIKRIDWLKKLATDENTLSILEEEKNSIIKNAAKSIRSSQNNEILALSGESENNLKASLKKDF